MHHDELELVPGIGPKHAALLMQDTGGRPIWHISGLLLQFLRYHVLGAPLDIACQRFFCWLKCSKGIFTHRHDIVRAVAERVLARIDKDGKLQTYSLDKRGVLDTHPQF
jgi:hypothetical protein